jgi:hypothetical protein
LRRSANLERAASDFANAIEIFAREYLPLSIRTPTVAADP